MTGEAPQAAPGAGPSPAALIVQKFGGSSVADAGRIRLCAQRAVDAMRTGHRVVVVVSAMGRTTDALVRMARDIDQAPPPRELDQLLAAGEQVSVALTAIAINAIGGRAVGLDARQAGITADGPHGRARIRAIDPDRIRGVIENGRIAVVAGFQGVDAEGSVATIGRGGSDTTAVALAAALDARMCEINTDTPGVMTADPSVVPTARRIERLGWEDVAAMSRRGARVFAYDAAELAQQHDVPLLIRHATNVGQGTIVHGHERLQGPIGCAISVAPPSASIALVGSALPQPVVDCAFDVLGPHAKREPDAIVLEGVDSDHSVALLRELHDAVFVARAAC